MSDHTPHLTDYLEQVRRRLNRIRPTDLDELMAAGAVVVDIRPQANRQEEGVLPGALILERNVLEWRFAPGSDSRLTEVHHEETIVIFCNDSYASSLAAVQLHDVGVPNATDLIGGYRAWRKLHPHTA